MVYKVNRVDVVVEMKVEKLDVDVVMIDDENDFVN
jgi:hypothetical protein